MSDQEDLERLEAELKALPRGPEKDPRFWSDFAGKVRRAYREAERPAWWAWLRPAGVIASLAAAAAVVLVIARPEPRPVAGDAADDSPGLVLADLAGDGEGASEEAIDDLVDDLDAEELQRAIAALDVKEER